MSEERDVKQEINKCSPNNFQFADDIEVRSMRAAGRGKENNRREGEQRDSSRGGRSEADSSMSESALAIKMSQ